MAICRWSSDDYTCDLYIYESVYGGIQVDVASGKYTHDPSVLSDLPQTPDLGLPSDSPEIKAFIREYNERHKTLKKLLDEAEIVPVGGPHDGRSFHFETPQEVIKFIQEELEPCAKYTIPTWLIERLKTLESD